jgi:hypothetical protein
VTPQRSAGRPAHSANRPARDASHFRGPVPARLALFYGDAALAFDQQHEVGIKPINHDVGTDYAGSRLYVELKRM